MKKLLASLALAIAAFGMVGGTALATVAPLPHYTVSQVAARLAPLGFRGCTPRVTNWPMTFDLSGGPRSLKLVGGPYTIRPQAFLQCFSHQGQGFQQSDQEVEIARYLNPAQVAYTIALAHSVEACWWYDGSVQFVSAGDLLVEAASLDGLQASSVTASQVGRALGATTVSVVHCRRGASPQDPHMGT